MLTQPLANMRSDARRASSKTVRRDASISLFQELYKYRGRIVLAERNIPIMPATEATFLCQILFLEFLAPRASARLPITPPHYTCSPKTFYRDTLQPQLRQWFPAFEYDALEIDSRVAFELVESFARYAWHMQTDSIQPWLLGYVYERWINQREAGSYFTPDLVAYNIAQLAIQEWLETHAKIELNATRELCVMGQTKKTLSPRARAWLRAKLDTVRIVDLSMGGGAFLVAAARVLFTLHRQLVADEFEPVSTLWHIFTNNLYGMDISAQARQVAQMRLWLLALELNAFDNTFQPLLFEHLQIGDALQESEPHVEFTQLRLLRDSRPPLPSAPTNSDFDICIGNPPFIALSQKSAVSNKERLVKQWNERQPRYALTPTVDLSNFFILRGIERLKPNGVLAYITSRNFFDTRYGAPLRRYLTEQVDLRNIITLHDHPFTQLGIKVKANTVILSLIKRAPQQIVRFQHLTFWNEPLSDAVGAAITRHALQTSSNWTNTLFDHPLRSALRARMLQTLGAYARVKMGVKSGCNSFFLVRADSAIYRQLAQTPGVFVPVVKNSRAAQGFFLSSKTAYHFLNLYERFDGLEHGFENISFNNPLGEYIFRAGIQYPCAQCQWRAEQQHETYPERFPHRGMCEQCAQCQQNGACDRPIDRLSTQGHLPAWYTLALGKPPLIAVQCIVDTEIGVFFNREGVYATDQFQVLDAPENPELGILLFMYLQSRVSHFLLEGSGLHRARFDGSFMLKIQVEHLRELGCPAFEKISPKQKRTLLALGEKFAAVTNRKTDTVSHLRDELDNIFLETLGYTRAESETIQPTLRAALEEAIRFRWVKTRTRIAALERDKNGN